MTILENVATHFCKEVSASLQVLLLESHSYHGTLNCLYIIHEILLSDEEEGHILEFSARGVVCDIPYPVYKLQLAIT